MFVYNGRQCAESQSLLHVSSGTVTTRPPCHVVIANATCLHGVGIVNQALLMPSFHVAHAAVAPVNGLFGGWGSISYSSPMSVVSEEPPYLCAVSGKDSSGRELIALLDEPPPPNGAVVRAREERTFAKPRSMSFGAAAQLPALALAAAAALHAVGLPTGCASIGASTKVPAHVLIAGSSGRMPALLVQMLAARGTRVCVAAQGKATRLRELGAAEVIDHNEQSFMSVLAERRNRPLDAVLDCVGAEDAAAAQLQQQAGAAYVSLASPGLTTLLERGALAGFSAQMRSWRRQQQPETDTDAPARVWEADETAAEALREVLAFIEAGTVVPPAEANGAAELMECYLEHVTWARDAETGLRFGFPGKSMWPSAPQAPRWDRGLPE